MHTIRIGEQGPAVLEVRQALQTLGLIPLKTAPSPRDVTAMVYDGACALAVRQFQQQRGLVADGEVDDETYRELMGARLRLGDRALSHDPKRRVQRGDDVRELQQQIAELGFDIGNIDGIFGPATSRGLADFQRDAGLEPTAIADAETFRTLHQMGNKVVGGSAANLRSRAARRQSGPALRGKTVVLDPAPAPTAEHASAPVQTVVDIAERLQARLSALGVHAPMTCAGPEAMSAPERADFANDQGADLYICVSAASNHSPQVEGMATYYFGTSEHTYSVPGYELADLVHREVIARTPFVDLGVHPRSVEMLRLTAMPAVRLEVGYLTNRQDSARLAEVHHREAIAEGIIAAVQRFYLDSPQEFQTGTWQLPADLREH